MLLISLDIKHNINIVYNITKSENLRMEYTLTKIRKKEKKQPHYYIVSDVLCRYDIIRHVVYPKTPPKDYRFPNSTDNRRNAKIEYYKNNNIPYHCISNTEDDKIAIFLKEFMLKRLHYIPLIRDLAEIVYEYI